MLQRMLGGCKVNPELSDMLYLGCEVVSQFLSSSCKTQTSITYYNSFGKTVSYVLYSPKRIIHVKVLNLARHRKFLHPIKRNTGLRITLWNINEGDSINLKFPLIQTQCEVNEFASAPANYGQS